MKPTIVGLLGKPLAGKDTVANILRREISDFSTVSVGDVVREVKATGPSHRFWDLMKDSIVAADSGALAQDGPSFEVITRLMEEKIADGSQVVAWIGGPRSLDQLAMLDGWVKEKGYKQDYLHIDTPEEILHSRREYRMQENGRTDDHPDAFEERLRVFDATTKPVIDRLRDEGRLKEVIGGDREIVGRRAVEVLIKNLPDPEPRLPAMARR